MALNWDLAQGVANTWYGMKDVIWSSLINKFITITNDSEGNGKSKVSTNGDYWADAGTLPTVTGGAGSGTLLSYAKPGDLDGQNYWNDAGRGFQYGCAVYSPSTSTWALTWGSALFYSTDNGVNWTGPVAMYNANEQLPDNNVGLRGIIASSNSGRYMALSTNYSIWKGTDINTWTRIYAPGNDVTNWSYGDSHDNTWIMVGPNPALSGSITIFRYDWNADTYTRTVLTGDGESVIDFFYADQFTYNSVTGVWVIAYATGIYVSTDDGVNWSTLRTFGEGAWFTKAAYGDGTICFVNTYGNYCYSTNGITWTKRKMQNYNAGMISGIIWGRDIAGTGTWVAINGSEGVMLSADLKWWSQSNFSTFLGYTAECLNGLAWNKQNLSSSVFLAASHTKDGNFVFFSLKDVKPGYDGYWSEIAASSTALIALRWTDTILDTSSTNSNTIVRSTDGINWSWTQPKSLGRWYALAYGAGTFVALGDTNTNMYSVDDGLTWDFNTNASTYAELWNDVCYGNGIFLAVANGTKVMTSPTGQGSWTLYESLPNFAWTSVAFGDGVFIAVAKNTDFVAISSDNGLTWTTKLLPSDQGSVIDQWSSITYGNGKFVMVQRSVTGETGGLVSFFSEDNGNTWQRTYLPVDPDSGYKGSWTSVTYGAEVFVAVSEAIESDPLRPLIAYTTATPPPGPGPITPGDLVAYMWTGLDWIPLGSNNGGPAGLFDPDKSPWWYWWDGKEYITLRASGGSVEDLYQYLIAPLNYKCLQGGGILEEILPTTKTIQSFDSSLLHPDGSFWVSGSVGASGVWYKSLGADLWNLQKQEGNYKILGMWVEADDRMYFGNLWTQGNDKVWRLEGSESTGYTLNTVTVNESAATTFPSAALGYDNVVYFCSDAGIYYLDDNDWELYPLIGDAVINLNWNIVVTAGLIQEGRLYFGGTNGIYYLDDKATGLQATNMTDAGSYITNAIVTPQGRAYFTGSGFANRLYYLTDVGTISYETLNLPKLLGVINNKLYISQGNNGISYYNLSGTGLITGSLQNTNITSGMFTTCGQSHYGTWYFGSSNNLGVYRLKDDGTIEVTNQNAGNFTVLSRDTAGTLYFGKEQGGVYYLNPTIISTGNTGVKVASHVKVTEVKNGVDNKTWNIPLYNDGTGDVNWFTSTSLEVFQSFSETQYKDRLAEVVTKVNVPNDTLPGTGGDPYITIANESSYISTDVSVCPLPDSPEPEIITFNVSYKLDINGSLNGHGSTMIFPVSLDTSGSWVEAQIGGMSHLQKIIPKIQLANLTNTVADWTRTGTSSNVAFNEAGELMITALEYHLMLEIDTDDPFYSDIQWGGNLGSGWTVEVYRNGALYGAPTNKSVATDRPNAEYNFNNRIILGGLVYITPNDGDNIMFVVSNDTSISGGKIQINWNSHV